MPRPYVDSQCFLHGQRTTPLSSIFVDEGFGKQLESVSAWVVGAGYMVVLRSWTVPQQNQGWQPLKNEQSLSHLPPITRLSELDMT